MASWPGTLTTRLSLAPFGVRGSDTRSEVYARNSNPNPNPTLGDSSPVQWGPRWSNDDRVLSSTASGTLQPVSPHLSGASPPRTTFTAPIFGINEAEDGGPSGNFGNDSKARNIENQRNQSLPSSQHSYPLENGPPACDNSVKLTELLKEVVTLQEEVAFTRVRARDFRRALRHKREEEDDLRLALRNRLNLIAPDAMHEELTTIHIAIQELQAVTEAYQVLESDYHKFEDELGQRESSLDKRMTRLNHILRKHASLITQQPDAIDSDSDVLPDSLSTGNVNQLSPKVAEYLSLVGEVRMLRDRRSELESEYLNLIDQRELRERIGISLDHEALAFLAGYNEERAKTEAELDMALRRAKAHPEHNNHDEAAGLDEQWKLVVKDFLPTSPEDQPLQDPLRMTEFEDRSPFFEERRAVPLNKTTFVNRWLLHRLRHSSFEMLRYKSDPELLDLMGQGWDGDSISQMALMLWFRDETARMVGVRSTSAG
ncbi:uncharacterized protein N7482_003990 [Penicillium canariense]|uniref:Uncharacterized protein n=1 Tax=Penicillium canariense TaxID=189055 RepID=A0A9W9I5S1_9EURO|nr:uncharacterized protein N7482_003990 [Penicillium canariense]KAJ5168396.1 hypothetical protein N7482_003990 [Penicillium canariense]